MRRLLSASFISCVLVFAAITQFAGAQTTAPNEWTWVGGNDTIGTYCYQTYFCGHAGVYGTQGTPASGIMPGSRDGAVSWTDTAGHLWMFGGEGLDSAGTYDFLNDLWEFDTSKSEWIWMGGASAVPSCGLQYCAEPGVYGTLGTSSSTNLPGNRINASGWADANGNFWLFGGTGLVANSSSIYLNDLWKFDPISGQWAWMSGSSTAPPAGSGGLPGVYGTLGVPATGNYPGSRSFATSWTDASGHLWLFGGAGYDSAGTFGSLNDLWEFLPATSQWVWMSGNSTIPCNAAQVCGQPGVYGTLGTASPSNLPGGRDAARMD